MVGYKAINTLTTNGSVKRGICNIENDKLIKLVESSIINENGSLKATSLETNENVDIDYETIVSMNMFGFTPKIFDYLEDKFSDFLNNNDLLKAEYLMPSVVNELVNEGKVQVDVLSTNARWYGITYKEDKEEFCNKLKKMIDNKEYPNNLWD